MHRGKRIWLFWQHEIYRGCILAVVALSERERERVYFTVMEYVYVHYVSPAYNVYKDYDWVYFSKILLFLSSCLFNCLVICNIEDFIHSPLNVDDSALWILYMLKQLLSSSQMKVMKPGCPGNVESGETSLSWLYPQSIGSQCKIKGQRYCVSS